MAAKTRSPLKDKPLRLPGQSVQEQRGELIENAIGEPFMLAMVFIILAGLEWWRFYMDMKPSPELFTAAAVLMTAYAGVRFWRARPKLRSLRQAIDGERAVGQFLERLREQGFHVFHDVVGKGFNVDHVLIGPPGVFTIETKTWSKPTNTRAEVVFDGDRLKIGSLEPERDPIIQAKAQAGWLRSLLAESTGRTFDVRPAIVFPGWFIENTAGSFKEVWVLEPKALPAFLSNEPVRLSLEDVNLASFHLSRFIRSTQT